MAASSQSGAFWVSLGISSTIQLLVVHVWTRQTPDLSPAGGRAAICIGLVVFLFGMQSSGSCNGDCIAKKRLKAHDESRLCRTVDNRNIARLLP
jgi:hypothetical protein